MRTDRTSVQISRRKLLLLGGLFVIGEIPKRAFGAGKLSLRATLIGATGRGDYGHGLDLIFKGLPGVDLVAVADRDAKGGEAARARTGAGKVYQDPLKMLAEEKPDLVCMAPRWTEDHSEIIRAALEGAAHVISEKPFTTNLAEADQLLEIADRKKLKIAVAHQMRLAPNIQKLREAVRNGLLGDLVQMRAYGKQDQRAGGEDMLVLGTHLFDLMRLMAGEARRCSASVWHKGEPARKEDRRKATEGIGWVLGDEIEAQFEFDGGVVGTFVSRAKLRQQIGRWRLELVGIKGQATILMDIDPDIMLLKAGTWTGQGRRDEWEPFAPIEAADKGTVQANRRLAMDWLTAIETGGEPACSGLNAAKAIEMVMAVYESALTGRKVELPLKNRNHPLES